MSEIGEILVKTAIVGSAFAGGFTGHHLVDTNIPSQTTIIETEQYIDKKIEDFKSLTKPSTCEDDVLSTALIISRENHHVITDSVMKLALQESCASGNNESLYNDLADRANNDLDQILTAEKTYKSMIDRANNQHKTKIIMSVLGAIGASMLAMSMYYIGLELDGDKKKK